MAVVKKMLRAGGLELALELDNGALRAVELPAAVPAKFSAADLAKIVSALSRYDFALDHATPFTRKVWERMRKIPAGKTLSYSALAAAVKHPKAARAVGGAVGANRLVIVLPCHRVVGKSGLGGFRCGLAWKRKLLELEGSG